MGQVSSAAKRLVRTGADRLIESLSPEMKPSAIINHQRQMKQLKQEQERLTMERDTAMKDREEQEARLRELRAEISESKAVVSNLDAKFQDISQTMCSMQSQVDEHDAETQAAEDRLRHDLAETQRKLAALRAKSDAARNELLQELESERKTRAKVQGSNEALETELQHARTELLQIRASSDMQSQALAAANQASTERSQAVLERCGQVQGLLASAAQDMHALSVDVHTECKETAADLARLGAQLVSGVRSAVHDARVANRRFMREAAERRRAFNALQDLRGNIRVFCRVRPTLPSEAEDGQSVVAANSDSNTVAVADEASTGAKQFAFDEVFDSTTTQAALYEEVSPLVMSAMDGYHCCIFAYGQTGSGKTYTMMGDGSMHSEKSGVYHRAMAQLFHEAAARADSWDFTMRVNMVEIYNESVRDLLVDPAAGPAPELDIRSNSDGGQYMPGVVEVPVTAPADIERVMERGSQNRSVTATHSNEVSSRSHSLLLVTIHGVNKVNGETTAGKLVLVDLAGSERVNKSGVTGQAMKEAQNINRSLSALGDVIAALANKAGHVPFRNSKLTWLLADSLAGNNKSLMIVQVAPTPASKGETLCSLAFASRVRKVEQGPAKKRRDAAPDETPKLKAALAKARKEIQALRAEADAAKAEIGAAKSAAAQATKAASRDRASKSAAQDAVDAKLAAVEAELAKAKAAAASAMAKARKAEAEAAELRRKAQVASKAASTTKGTLASMKEAHAAEVSALRRRVASAERGVPGGKRGRVPASARVSSGSTGSTAGATPGLARTGAARTAAAAAARPPAVPTGATSEPSTPGRTPRKQARMTTPSSATPAESGEETCPDSLDSLDRSGPTALNDTFALAAQHEDDTPAATPEKADGSDGAVPPDSAAAEVLESRVVTFQSPQGAEPENLQSPPNYTQRSALGMSPHPAGILKPGGNVAAAPRAAAGSKPVSRTGATARSSALGQALRTASSALESSTGPSSRRVPATRVGRVQDRRAAARVVSRAVGGALRSAQSSQ